VPVTRVQFRERQEVNTLRYWSVDPNTGGSQRLYQGYSLERDRKLTHCDIGQWAQTQEGHSACNKGTV